MHQDLYSYCKQHYGNHFGTVDGFDTVFDKWKYLEPFKSNENIWDTGQEIDEQTHFIMRTATQYYLSLAFEAMKIDLSDDNIAEDLDNGNIGTPGRLAKMWNGSCPKDYSELGSGRWNQIPRIAKFKNEQKGMIVEKTIELTSNCSHHFVPFSTLYADKSYCVVKYVAEDYVIGISKLKRVINDFLAKRFYLQEDLTQKIGEYLQKITESKSVYVKLSDIQHGCEKFRGAKDSEGGMTTTFKTGVFDE